MRFYFVADCDNCDEEVFYGPVATLLEHDGLPVVTYDMAAQTNFYCERCGASNYTGDLELESEGGTDPDELEDDEDEFDDEDEPETEDQAGGDPR